MAEQIVRRLDPFRQFLEVAALCVSRGPARMRMEGVLCLRWRDALAELGLA